MMNRRWWAGLAGLAGIAIPLLAADWLPSVRPRPGEEPERSPSYWMQTIPDLPRCPRVEQDLHVDVAVIGGGFTGLAIAYYLKRNEPSLRVAVLEMQRMGSGASSRNSGAVGPRFRGQTLPASADRGYQLLKAFAETEGLDFDLVESVPALTLYTGRRVAPDTVLTGDELCEQIGSQFYSAATLRYTNTLHPGKLIAGLVEANRRHGVELYEWSPVLRIERGRGSEQITLHTPGGRVVAPDVAVATNAYTPQLGLARDIIAVVHHRVIVTRPLTEDQWARSRLERWPIRFEDGGYYTHTVRGTPDRRFFYRHVLGHRVFERTTWPLDRHAREVGHWELVRRYPWLDGVPVEYEWHGVTARTRDWWPVSGRIDEHLYIAAGYNGSGVMPSHYFGYLIACSILGIPDQDLGLLRPPEAHSRIPGEFARHLCFHGWMLYRRWRDGRDFHGHRLCQDRRSRSRSLG
jgi:glycine/D-amino acid oxidase-like deaminating enzyme